MEQESLKLIEEIPIPESLKQELIKIQPTMIATFEKNAEWDFTSGYMPRPKLDCISDIYWETFLFITEINEVIENLNLVIADLSFLSKHSEIYRQIRGRLSKKYSLMVRAFFYELFRTKEIFNRYLQYLKKARLLRKTDIKGYRDEFIKLFEAFIKIRNRMVHHTFALPGEEYQKLWMAEFALENHMAFASQKTGAIITTADALEKLSAEFNEVAFSVGTSLVQYFQAFSHGCCEVTDQIKEGKIALLDNKE